MMHPVERPRWTPSPAVPGPGGRATVELRRLRNSARQHPAVVLTAGIGLGLALGWASQPIPPRTTQAMAADGTEATGDNCEHDTGEHEKETAMGMTDKITHKAEELTGKAKEALGNATGNDDLAAQGQADQAQAQVHQAGDQLADAKHDAGEGVRRAADEAADAAQRVKDHVAEAVDDVTPSGDG